MLTLDKLGFQVESIQWDKRKLFYIDKSYDESVAAMNIYMSNNTTFKYIRIKLAGKYKMRNE